MKAAEFDYFRPTSLDQALELLAETDGSAKVLAGGQTLVPMMAFRMAQPSALIDLNRIGGLNYIREDGDILKIGAMTRHRDVERSELVNRYCPLLAEAIRLVAHPIIRNRGTAGGSLSHADPAAEWPTVAVALGAKMLLRNAQRTRLVSARDFFISLLTTALMPDEILVEVQLPKIQKNVAAAFLEVSRRHGDFALVSVAAQVGVSQLGEVNDVRLVLGGVDMTPIDVSGTAKIVIGRKLADQSHEDVSRAIAKNLETFGDVHASADYRREVAAGLITRALSRCQENFEGQHG